MTTLTETIDKPRPSGSRGNGSLARRILLAVLPVFLFAGVVRPDQYFVAPAGSDSADGSEAAPFRTLQYAVTLVAAGDTITMREGVYDIGVTVRPLVSGTAVSPILLRAHPGESPILDFHLQTPSTSARGLHFSASYWHVEGLTVRNAGDNGIFISGNYNVVERCTMYGNEDTGLQISNGGSYNYVYNCDSYANYDSATHGENADGFAPKLDVGPGNVLRGCRAWDNADDGWDAYQAAYEVVIDSCWAFRNGYNIWGDPAFQGDGNGFKLGGNFVPAHQLITRSVAFDNRSKGFDQNNNTAGITLHNNTAWRNLGNNFSFPLTPTVGQHVLVNNIAWGAVSIEATAQQSSNSWQGYTVTAGDFLSLDTALARAPRNPDGSLPDVGFLHLAGASQFINEGEDVGLPYLGSAPDFGAFESNAVPALFALGVTAVNGSVLKDPDLPVYDSASVVRLTAVPSPGHHFTNWSGDLAGTANPDSVVMDTAKSVTAHFAINRYALDVSVSGDGSVLRDPDSAEYDHGDTVTLTAVPGPGYHFVAWSGDTAGTVNPFGVVMDAGKSVTALFESEGVTSPVAVGPDWTLVSVPVAVADNRKSALFPSALSNAFRYADGYDHEDSLLNGVGYWLKFSAAAETVSISGGEILADTFAVGRGMEHHRLDQPDGPRIRRWRRVRA